MKQYPQRTHRKVVRAQIVDTSGHTTASFAKSIPSWVLHGNMREVADRPYRFRKGCVTLIRPE